MKDEYNCRNKKYCPLGGKSLSPNIIYQGKKLQPNPITRTKFTLELHKSCSKINHTKSFIHEDYANDTEKSKEYWKLKGITLFQK